MWISIALNEWFVGIYSEFDILNVILNYYMNIYFRKYFLTVCFWNFSSYMLIFCHYHLDQIVLKDFTRCIYMNIYLPCILYCWKFAYMKFIIMIVWILEDHFVKEGSSLVLFKKMDISNVYLFCKQKSISFMMFMLSSNAAKSRILGVKLLQ